jgi:hypothetical protein
MPRIPRSPRPSWAAAPLAALTVLAVSACGSGSHPDATAARAFTQCLSVHGVTLPHRTHNGTPPSGAPSGGAGQDPHRDLTVPPPGVDQQTWDNARAACASLAPSQSNTAGS